MKKTEKTEGEQYFFFLSPYSAGGLSKCPKCKRKTRQKKLPLAISMGYQKKEMLLFLNKTCKYCPSCDLLIAKEHEIKEMLRVFL